MTLDAEHPGDTNPEPPDASEPDRASVTSSSADSADEDSTSGVDPSASGPPPRRRGGGTAGLLGAAMLAVGEILEPEKTTVEIVQTDDDPLDDLPFQIDFGDLPPLD